MPWPKCYHSGCPCRRDKASTGASLTMESKVSFGGSLSMDRGAWRAAVQGVAKSWTQLSTYVCIQWIITADGVPTTEMDYVALNVILNQAWATGEIGWDLGPFTKVLAPGQTSGLGAMEYNHTIRDWKQLNACAIRKVTHKKIEKG